METIENIKQAGLRMTPQRKTVYEAMMELRHAGIDEIVALLPKTGFFMSCNELFEKVE